MKFRIRGDIISSLLPEAFFLHNVEIDRGDISYFLNGMYVCSRLIMFNPKWQQFTQSLTIKILRMSNVVHYV